jgi:uncharacterized glyoxalase superfamily protein PhnB
MSVFPSLRYRDARAGIEFLQRAFGFEPLHVYDAPDGGVAHAEVRAGKGIVMLGDHKDDRFGDHTGQGWTYVAVPEVDDLFARAREAGAEVVRTPEDQDYGSRDFSVRDPEGNLWSFGTYEPEAAR